MTEENLDFAIKNFYSWPHAAGVYYNPLSERYSTKTFTSDALMFSHNAVKDVRPLYYKDENGVNFGELHRSKDELKKHLQFMASMREVPTLFVEEKELDSGERKSETSYIKSIEFGEYLCVETDTHVDCMPHRYFKFVQTNDDVSTFYQKLKIEVDDTPSGISIIRLCKDYDPKISEDYYKAYNKELKFYNEGDDELYEYMI